MHIDYTTLLLAASWPTAVFTLLCGVISHAEVALRPLRLCSVGNLCFTVGMPLLILRGGRYDVLGNALGNALIFMGWALQVAADPPSCRPDAPALAGTGDRLPGSAPAWCRPSRRASRCPGVRQQPGCAAWRRRRLGTGPHLDGTAGHAGPDLAGLRHPPGGAGRASGRRRPVRAGGGPGPECADHPGRDPGAFHLYPRAARRGDAPGGAADACHARRRACRDR